MATGKSGSFELSGTKGITVKVTWSETYDVATNTSVVSIDSLQVKSSQYTAEYWINGPIKVDGSAVITFSSVMGTHVAHVKYKNTYYSTVSKNNTPAPWKSGSITHNSDGTKSVMIELSISGATTNGQNGSGWTVKASQTIELTDIPRTSAITSAADIELGNACNVKWTPATASFRYKLKFSLGNWSYTTGVIHPNSTSAYTYTGYTIPLDVAYQLPNAYVGDMSAILYTYSDSAGTALIGSESKTFKVTVPSSVKPKVTVTASPVHSLPAAFNGLYVQGLSKVKATMVAETYYGATMQYYDVTIEGVLYDIADDYTSGYITGKGEVWINGHAVDSRSYGGYGSIPINVLPYTSPTLQNVTAERCTADGKPNVSGTCLRIKAKRVYSPCVASNSQKNFCDIRYRYRAAKESFWSDWAVVLAGSNTASDEITSGALLNGALLVSDSYVVEVQVIDTIGYTASVTIVVPTDKVYWHRDGANNALGLGKYAEAPDTLDMDWNIKTKKNIDAEGNCTIGGTMSAAAIDADGDIIAEGTVYAAAVDADGDIDVGGTVNAAAVVTVGNVNVGGTLTADLGRLGYYRNLDFNTLTSKTGYYVDSSAPGGVGSTNYPVNVTGMLEVVGYGGSFAYQTYRTYDGSVYFRSYYKSTGWTAWKQVKFV